MDVEGFSGAVEDVHLISLAVPHTMQNRFRDDVGQRVLNRMEVQLAAHTLEDGDQCSECSAVKLAGSE
jgi:hypothetical protein